MLSFGLFLFILLILFVLWRFFFFFRNPKRDIPYNDRHILSPADGRVIYIKRVKNSSQEPLFSIKNRKVIRLTELMHFDDSGLADRDGYLIGIFMSPFDVHYNRAPIEGEIRKIAHGFPDTPLCRRENRGMFNSISNLFFEEKPYWHDCDYLIDNERASFVIKNKKTTLYLTQIAEKWVRRIVTYKDRQPIAQGEVFGLIRMGSQVDIFVPDPQRYRVVVREGHKVKAGLSVLLEEFEARD